MRLGMYGMRHTLLGEVGLCALSAGSPAWRHEPTIHIKGVSCRRNGIDRAIDALRAANVPPNEDGTYSMKTIAGNVVRVKRTEREQ